MKQITYLTLLLILPFQLAWSQCDFEINTYTTGCVDDDEYCIHVEVTGGTAPYSMNWSEGLEFLPTLSGNLDPICGENEFEGTVDITDANGCTQMVQVIIVPMRAYIGEMDYDFCTGATFIANPQQGRPPFTYEWSSGETTESILATIPGDYSLTITDSEGCTDVATRAFFVNMDVTITEETCFQSFDGSIMINIPNWNSYSYSWVGPGGFVSFDRTIEYLEMGLYTLTILRDNTNCPYELEPFYLGSPQGLMLELTGSDETCIDEGFIQAEVSGGIPPYTYEINGEINNGSIFFNLIAGYYEVTVYDLNECNITSGITINSPIQ